MKVLTDNKYYGQIADVIREQNGTSNTYTPPQMVSALKDLFYEEVEGAPPITFQGIGENLLDYRIDGASGGVGDRTKNLFNEITYQGTVTNAGSITGSTTRIRSEYIDVDENETYTYSGNLKIRLIYAYDNGYNKVKCIYDAVQDGKVVTFVMPIGATKIMISFMDAGDPNNEITPNDFLWGQLEKGLTATDYEPYGYKVPVVVSGKNIFNFNEWSENLTANGNNELIISNNSITITAVENDAFTTPYYTNHPNIYRIDVLPNSQYVLSWDSNNTLSGAIFVFKNGLTGSGNQISVNNATQKYITFSTDGNTTFITIRFGVRNAGDSITYSHIQLEEGSTATDYEPYHEPTTINIYLDENIPSEYTEVEYIESTGTQYINTNIIPTNTTGVEAKITICNDNNRDNVFMGCRDTANGDSRYWIDVDWTGTDTLIFGFNNNTSANERYSLKGSDVGKSFIISMNYMNDRTGKINGITYDTSISSKTLVSISKPIYIFAGNRSGNAAYQYSGKLYNFKITDGTNVIRNFVPCYRNSDNVAGLYDLVNNTFYTNQGTGNFIVGPIKENESISLSDTNTNIPTIRGTNVLTVDTTVQPSNVYVKSRHESSYEAAMRERYEEAQAQLDALESGGE